MSDKLNAHLSTLREVDSIEKRAKQVTASAKGDRKWGLDTFATIMEAPKTDETVDSSASLSEVTIAGTLAEVGDKVTISGEERTVISKSGDTLKLDQDLSADPTGQTMSIMSPTTLVGDAAGSLNVNAVQTPIKFLLDGAEQEVTEDTVTPANNAPLPVKLTSTTGDINITAGDLNVQLSHSGASADSTQIGDGTEILLITPSGEATTSDSTTHTKLDDLEATLTNIETSTASIAAEDFATETTLAALNAKVVAADTTGKATEAKQDSAILELQQIEADIEAGNTTLSSLLTELQAKADLTETQPVSAASLPLPAGASTEAKQDSAIVELQDIEADIEASNVLLTSLDGKDYATQTTLATLLTELQAKADLAETQPVSLASQPLPTGAATEAKQDSAITELQDIEADVEAVNATLTAQAADIGLLEDRLAGSLVPKTFDYIALTYVAAGNGAGEIETATYRTGGAAGTIVATLTLAYDAQDRITSVTRS